MKMNKMVGVAEAVVATEAGVLLLDLGPTVLELVTERVMGQEKETERVMDLATALETEMEKVSAMAQAMVMDMATGLVMVLEME